MGRRRRYLGPTFQTKNVEGVPDAFGEGERWAAPADAHAAASESPSSRFG